MCNLAMSNELFYHGIVMRCLMHTDIGLHLHKDSPADSDLIGTSEYSCDPLPDLLVELLVHHNFQEGLA